MPHNPNPFDFVPFGEAPILKSRAEFDSMGELMSGYLEVQIFAMTPVHIVGALQRERDQAHSALYRQAGRGCIPASTVRGAVRSFVEALTSGWVSQANLDYPKVFRRRHVGYRTFANYRDERGRISDSAVEPAFQPNATVDNQLDVASYLFGIVIEDDDNKENAISHKGKVWFEDAYIPDSEIVANEYWYPDINSDAFMGGGKPSASNWWYFKPKEIWRRETNGLILAEFVGRKLRGRKFYYHQMPKQCLALYDPNSGKSIWRYNARRPFQKVTMECMKPGKQTERFRIYLDRVPKSLLHLFVSALQPGQKMAHKLGYAKAYGYGSVAFSIVGAQLRSEESANRTLPDRLQDMRKEIAAWTQNPWDRATMGEAGIDPLIDHDALGRLAQILGLEDSNRIHFTYPPFARQDFMTPVQFFDLEQNAPKGITVTRHMRVTEEQGEEIAEALFEIKRPIDLSVYQKRAAGWDLIARRKP